MHINVIYIGKIRSKVGQREEEINADPGSTVLSMLENLIENHGKEFQDVVFDRDELVGGDAHSNFKITQTKGNEVFMLSDAGSVLQDSIRVLPNQNSHTRGRETNGAANWSVFVNGTPNANNLGAMQEYATTPVFSQIGGYYSATVNLTLSSPDPNITIYYTTNGDEPDNTSAVYSGPINIATTTVVKAVAYSSTANIPTSFIDYHTFFINDTHTIPILSISGGQVDNLLNGIQIEPEGSSL